MTTLQSATSTLLTGYDQVLAGRSPVADLFNGDTIDVADLTRIVTDPDPGIPQPLRDAAQFLLDSKVARNFLDVGAQGGRPDGEISRADLSAAIDRMAAGDHFGDMVRTADAGSVFDPGPAASPADIQLALLDPAVPETVKDALRLAILGDAGADPGPGLVAMTDADYVAAAAIYNSAEFAALPVADQALVAEAFRDGQGNGTSLADIGRQLRDPSFQASDAATRTAKLTEFVLLHSPEFAALSPTDQAAVSQALASRDASDVAFPVSVKHLIESGEFAALPADARTAVLAQVQNYHESKAVGNIDRLLDLGWFQGMSLDDQQRTLKTIAYMSVYDNGGDRTTLDNTLEKLLDPAQGYSLEWTTQAPGVGAHSNPGTRVVSMNLVDVPADNAAVTAQSVWQIVNAVPHEINHAIDDVHVDSTFAYLDKEYQAYVTGMEAQNGRPVTRAEAVAIWQTLLDKNGVYAESSHGVERDWWWDSDGALDKSGEASQIFATLSDLTGITVTADNYEAVMKNPFAWNPPGGGDAAPAAGRPEGNTDNH